MFNTLSCVEYLSTWDYWHHALIAYVNVNIGTYHTIAATTTRMCFIVETPLLISIKS